MAPRSPERSGSGTSSSPSRRTSRGSSRTILSISSFVLAFRISGCAAGSLLTGEPGSFARLTTPAYSEWSGDARPVERRVDLDVETQRMLDRLALEVLVRVAGIGEEVSDRKRVERPARVDVGLAEVGVAVGVRREGRQTGHDQEYDTEQRSHHATPGLVIRTRIGPRPPVQRSVKKPSP